MAIERDATSTGTDTTTVLTVSHTCTGDDRILFVSTRNLAGVNNTPSGVTYDSEDMNLIATAQSGSGRNLSLWYLIAPNIGVNNIVVTHSVSVEQFADGGSYTGVRQSGQPDASNTYSSGDNLVSTIPVTVTTVANNSWAVITGQAQSDLATVSAGTNATALVGNLFDNQTNGDITPAGSFQMILDLSQSRRARGIMASFAPAVVTFIPKVMIF